jgi:serine/threonine protein kinase
MDMELCAKRTLTDFINERKASKNNNFDFEVIAIFHQILSGVQYLHDKNIIHSDLKPDNILFGLDTKTVKITDFGLAKFFDETSNDESFSPFKGTPVYSAPEKVQGNNYDKKSDMYSLGIIFLELVQNFENFESFKECADKLSRRIYPNELNELKINDMKEIADIIWNLTDIVPKNRPDASDLINDKLFFISNEKDKFHMDIILGGGKMREKLEEEIKVLKEKNKSLEDENKSLKEQNDKLTERIMQKGYGMSGNQKN